METEQRSSGIAQRHGDKKLNEPVTTIRANVQLSDGPLRALAFLQLFASRGRPEDRTSGELFGRLTS